MSIKNNIEFQSLCIKDLSFELEEQRFENIHLTKNQCISIECKSKYGKDKLYSIIQKKEDCERGTIIINNQILINDINKGNWKDIIGIVPEKIKIFPSHILDNIILDEQIVSEKEHSFEDIHAFIKEYGFEDFIKSFSEGYATILSNEVINLSEGQKYILGLIRVLYKKPQLLILNNFLLAIDKKTENFVLQMLKRLKSKISIIFISDGSYAPKLIVDKTYMIGTSHK